MKLTVYTQGWIVSDLRVGSLLCYSTAGISIGAQMGNIYHVANHNLALRLSLLEADTFSTFTFSHTIYFPSLLCLLFSVCLHHVECKLRVGKDFV